jgi:hypothetical protein
LIDKIISANDPKRGWYSGIYESGIGYNKSITANTNGIILEAMLYKTLGPLHQRCAKCHRNRKPEMNANILAKCPIKPGQACASCQAKVAR